jgi:hypothetical protein
VSWDLWNACEKLAIRGWPKSVLLYLAARRNPKTGRCDPSLDRIALGTGANKKTVVTAIAELEWNDLVSSQHRKRKTVAYTLNLEAIKHFQKWKPLNDVKHFQKRTPSISKNGYQTLKENPDGSADAVGAPPGAQVGRVATEIMTPLPPRVGDDDPPPPAERGSEEARARARDGSAPAPAHDHEHEPDRGSRAAGTNPRALHTNPRARGTNLRVVASGGQVTLAGHEHEARQGRELAPFVRNGLEPSKARVQGLMAAGFDARHAAKLEAKWWRRLLEAANGNRVMAHFGWTLGLYWLGQRGWKPSYREDDYICELELSATCEGLAGDRRARDGLELHRRAPLPRPANFPAPGRSLRAMEAAP